MISDITFILHRWRIVHLLGIMKMRERYSRSKLGQLWLTVSNLVYLILVGIVWSVIWKMPIDEFLPYIGVGHVVYVFMAQTLNESSGVFVADGRYYLNEKIPFIMSIFTHIYRSFLVFLHNLPLFFILVLWSTYAFFSIDFVWILSVGLLLVFLFFSSYIIASTSTRFRDLEQVFGIIFQLTFLISPVMWKISFLPEEYRSLVMLNPIAAFLELIRNPIIGLNVQDYALISAFSWTAFAFIFAFFLHKKFDKQIIFWI